MHDGGEALTAQRTVAGLMPQCLSTLYANSTVSALQQYGIRFLFPANKARVLIFACGRLAYSRFNLFVTLRSARFRVSNHLKRTSTRFFCNPKQIAVRFYTSLKFECRYPFQKFRWLQHSKYFILHQNRISKCFGIDLDSSKHSILPLLFRLYLHQTFCESCPCRVLYSKGKSIHRELSIGRPLRRDIRRHRDSWWQAYCERKTNRNTIPKNFFAVPAPLQRL
jgi:hypothetical protein